MRFTMYVGTDAYAGEIRVSKSGKSAVGILDYDAVRKEKGLGYTQQNIKIAGEKAYVTSETKYYSAEEQEHGLPMLRRFPKSYNARVSIGVDEPYLDPNF